MVQENTSPPPLTTKSSSDDGGSNRRSTITRNISNPIARRRTANQQEQVIYVRPETEVRAMTWNERVKTRMQNYYYSYYSTNTEQQQPSANDGSPTFQQPTSENKLNAGSTLHLDDTQPPRKTLQYRFEKAPNIESIDKTLYRRIITLNGLFARDDKTLNNRVSSTTSIFSLGLKSNLSYYIHLMFRIDFVLLFIGMCMAFFAFVFLFTCVIVLAAMIDEQCIIVGGEEFGSAGTSFADAFSLSWTTFSTVGYGTSFPALGYQNSNPMNSVFINLICCVESLMGALYAGFCGAILFGKILRIQSIAQVIFSDPVVIRYGTEDSNKDTSNGNGRHDNGGDDEMKKKDNTSNPEQFLPFPVLEFRIINRLFKENGGEIMDASISVVANVDEHDGTKENERNDSNNNNDDSHHSSSENGLSVDASSTALRDERIKASINPNNNKGGLFSPISPRRVFNSSITRSTTSSSSSTNNSNNRRRKFAVDEGQNSSARFINRHIFCKMNMETSEHPFFKRVWLVRHVLNENSPLLNHTTRRLIRKNNGRWPQEINMAKDIRDTLHFNQILVSLNGVSNISASEVYAQKIYDAVDVHVGFEFVSVLYKEDDGSLGVDINLINDVQELSGGRAESLLSDEEQ